MSPKIVDLEMDLPAVDGRKKPLRLDVVSLEQAADGIRLVFWEGKMMGDGRLRSKVHKPRVFEQIDAYRSYLRDGARQHHIIEAYRRFCGIIRDLHEKASRVTSIPPLNPLIPTVAELDSHIAIEGTPRLLVIDHDRKRRHDAWQTYRDVLRRRVPVAIVKPGTPMSKPLKLIQEINGGSLGPHG